MNNGQQTIDNVRNSLTQKIIGFLTEIGIEIVPARISDETFLPGILVENGKLLVDEEKLKYPGDLLHEAGHLALATSETRSSLSGEVILPDENMNEIEIGVIAWGYAAIVFLNIEPQVLFHEGGYHGKSESLIMTYSMGVYPGAFSLQKFGLTLTGKSAEESNIAPYPNMLKWIRD